MKLNDLKGKQLAAQAAITNLIRFGDIMLARFESGIEGATEWGALKFAIEDAKKLDLSALEKHDEEVRKPLVDLLRRVNQWLYDKGHDITLRTEIDDALAKVKQPTIEFHGDQFLSKEG
jgi:hypothetical protein